MLIFDFFGVICSEVAPYWLADHFGVAESLRIKSGVVADSDVGALTQEQLFSELGRLSGLPAGQVLEEWRSLVRIDSEVVELIDELCGKFRIALLTNSPSGFVQEIIDRHKLRSRFEQVIVSSEEGLVKPDPMFFRLALARLGVTATASMFVDDNPINVASAESVGLNGIVFSSVLQLREDLKRSVGAWP